MRWPWAVSGAGAGQGSAVPVNPAGLLCSPDIPQWPPSLESPTATVGLGVLERRPPQPLAAQCWEPLPAPSELGDSHRWFQKVCSWAPELCRKPPWLRGLLCALAKPAMDENREVWEQVRAQPRAPSGGWQQHPGTPTLTRRVCGGPGLPQGSRGHGCPPRCSPLRDRWWVGVEAPSNMALSRKSMVDSVYTIWKTCPSRAHSSSAATYRRDAAAPLGTFPAPGPSGAAWAPGLSALWGSEVTGPPQDAICSSFPCPGS